MSIDDEFKPFIALSLLFTLIIGGATAYEWYKAGQQAALYKRQGIQMTQWEVFIGLEPAERVIQVRDGEVPR